MGRLQNFLETQWAFYEAKESGSIEGMVSAFETLVLHYKRRGQIMKEKDKRFWKTMNDWKEDVNRIKKSDD